MRNLILAPINRRILFCSAVMVGTGIVLGVIAASAVLLPRVHEAEAVTLSLQGINALQSSRIVELNNHRTSIAAPAPAPAPAPALDQPLPMVFQAEVAVLQPLDLIRAPTASVMTTTPIVEVAPVPSVTTTVLPTVTVKAGTGLQPGRSVTAPAPRLATKIIPKPSPPAIASPIVAASPVVTVLTPAAAAALAVHQTGRNAINETAKEPVNSATTSMVTLEQAGITGLDISGVRFKSGRQVAVGSEFPSGEKLLSVNPADGRIVTDRRVIVVAKPQLEK